LNLSDGIQVKSDGVKEVFATSKCIIRTVFSLKVSNDSF